MATSADRSLATGLAAGGSLAPASTEPAAAATLDQLSDRTHKINMLAKLGYQPKLVFFGGSRSMRFEPSYVRYWWGIRGFNATVQSCKNEDVWALVHHVVRRDPGRKKYIVWGIQPEAFFSDQVFDVALVKDRRLSRSFPYALRQTMGTASCTRGRPAGGTPATARFCMTTTTARRRGVTLEEALAAYIKKALSWDNTADTIPTRVTRTRTYFERTLAYMSAQGFEPLLIILPMHPDAIAALRDDHWDNRRASFAAYLAGLQQSYRFTVLDFTFIESFGGDPDAFYNAAHMKLPNLRRLLRAAVRKAPWAFGLAPSSTAPPTSTSKQSGAPR